MVIGKTDPMECTSKRQADIREMRYIKRFDEWDQSPSAKTSPKRAAHMKLRIAVRSGKIKKPDHCSNCGAKCNPEGHHTDYNKPLNVRWLCSSCHSKYHNNKKEK